MMGNHWESFQCDFCKRVTNYPDAVDFRQTHPFTDIFGKMGDGGLVVSNNSINGQSEIEACGECINKIIKFINLEIIGVVKK